MKRRIILDMDTGIDDAFALCYAISDPEIELIGVTCTYGNVETAAGARNARDILDFFSCSDVPVYAGDSHPLAGAFTRSAISARIHGENGVGQVEFPHSDNGIEEEPAVSFLKRCIMEYGSSLTIVTTGPMTNLGRVFQEAPELAERTGLVVSMGGALTVEGNVSPYAEANIHKDPDAARIVMESGVRFILVPLDVTMRSRLTRKDAEAFRSLDTRSGILFSRMLEYYIDNTLSADDTYIHDPSAIICAVHPEYFHLLDSQLTVITTGEARGRVVVDSSRILERPSRTSFCIDIDSASLQTELLDKLKLLFSRA